MNQSCLYLIRIKIQNHINNFTTARALRLGGPFKNPEFLVKFHNSLVSKVKVICPIVGQTIFRILGKVDHKAFY